GEHKFVEALFTGLEKPEFITAVTGPAGEGHWPAIAFLRTTFRERTRVEWQTWFEGRDICWSPVATLKEAWDADHVWERGMRFKDAKGNDHIGSAVRFDREPAQINTELPTVGGETAKIIAELDLTEADRKAILSEIN
ncbi:MAG: CoA transferase, partial [Halieaceae bacterium]